MSDPFAPDRPKRRLKPLGKLVVYGGLAGVLGAGAAGATLWFWRPVPQLPKLLPARTQAVLLVRPTVRALVGLPLARRVYPEAFEWRGFQELRAELVREWGLELERDVLPWVGAEAALALLGAAPQDAGAEAAGIAAVTARDLAGADAALLKAAAHRRTRGARVEAATHDGVRYQLETPPGAPGAPARAFGRIGSAVVMASGEGAFRALVDQLHRKGGPALAAQPGFRAVEGGLPRDAVFTGYMAGGTEGAALARSTMKAPAGGADDPAAWLAGTRGAGFGLAMRGDGVLASGVLALDPAQLPPEARAGLEEAATPVAPLVEEAPAEALAAISFRFPPALRDVLAKAWRDQRLPPSATQALTRAGIDVEQDLLAWLPGDMALVALTPAGAGAKLPVQGYWAVRPTQPDLAGAALDRLTTALRQALAGAPTLTLAEEDAPGGTWHVLRDRIAGEVVAAYGRFGGEVKLAIGPAAYAATAPGQAKLAGTPRFGAVAAHLPRRHAGLFFVDVERGRALAGPFLPAMPTTPPAALARGADAVRAVGGAFSPGLGRDGLLKGSVFMHMTVPTVNPE